MSFSSSRQLSVTLLLCYMSINFLSKAFVDLIPCIFYFAEPSTQWLLPPSLPPSLPLSLSLSVLMSSYLEEVYL